MSSTTITSTEDLRLEETSERVLYKLFLEWDEETRLVEILVLDGNPLLGTLLMYDHHLQVEMREGGEVVIEPL